MLLVNVSLDIPRCPRVRLIMKFNQVTYALIDVSTCQLHNGVDVTATSVKCYEDLITAFTASFTSSRDANKTLVTLYYFHIMTVK